MSYFNKIGAAILDEPKRYDPSSNNPGYMSLPSQQATRIFGTGELTSEVKWLTNIDSEVSYQNQLRDSPRILSDRYLRTQVSSMLLELGLRKTSTGVQAEHIAKIFRNVMTLSSICFGIDELPANTLRSAIPSMIGHYHPKYDRQILDASAHAVQTFTKCECKIENNTIFTSAVIPRFEHASKIFAGGLPWGSFRFLSQSEMPPAGHKRLNWVKNNDYPCLVKVRIIKTKRDYNQLISFGSGAGAFNRKFQTGGKYLVQNDHRFIMSNELAVLSELAEIEIDEIAISDREIEFERYRIPDTSRFARLSYSFGILLENYWYSLTSNEDGKPCRSPLTAWIHAIDRMWCLKYAMQLHHKGYSISGYGCGRLTFSLREEMIPDFLKDCQAMRLLPSMELVNDPDLEFERSNIKIPENPKSNDLLAGAHLLGDLEMLMSWDDRFVDNLLKEQRDQVV